MDDGTCASREETRASLHKPLPPHLVSRLLRQGAHQALIIAIPKPLLLDMSRQPAGPFGSQSSQSVKWDPCSSYLYGASGT